MKTIQEDIVHLIKIFSVKPLSLREIKSLTEKLMKIPGLVQGVQIFDFKSRSLLEKDRVLDWYDLIDEHLKIIRPIMKKFIPVKSNPQFTNH